MTPSGTSAGHTSAVANYIADFCYNAGKKKAGFAFGRNSEAISFRQWVQNRIDEDPELTDLRAKAAKWDEHGWQTIDSAPRKFIADDWVWVFGGNFTEPTLRHSDWDYWTSTICPVPPTHFMRLSIPAPPTGDA